MHDVIRDMALWIVSEQGKKKYRWIVESDTYKHLKVIPNTTEKLSLICNRTDEISCHDSCSSNKLSTLLLQANWSNDTKMLWLKSFGELAVLDLSFSFNEFLRPSSNDRVTFPIEICTLVKLQFLNLSGNSDINSLPKEFGALINLKYLLLRRMSCTIPKGVLSKLKSLRMLDGICFDLRWQTEYSSETFWSLEEELQCLSKFQALGIFIASTQDDESITDWFLGNSHLQSSITKLYIRRVFNSVKFERASGDHRICRLQRLERLCLKGADNMKEVVWKGINPKDVFPRLQFLKFSGCKMLRSISWVACLPCIRELKVEFCDNIRHLICIFELNNDELMTSQPFLSSLRKMNLRFNNKLKSISDPMIVLSALDYLNIVGCNNLKKLPFKTCEPPKELILHGTEEWWNNIEMDSTSHRPILQPFFIKGTDWLDSVGSAFRVSYNMREQQIQ